MIPLLLVLQAAAAPAAPAADPPAQTGREVVVTAHPLADTARALAECLARHCPPGEDIRATLAHAENQFVAGDYPAARRTLLAGRGRNARYAHTLPVEVAELSRANARLAGLNGFAGEALLGEIESVGALRAGLPDDDPRVLLQRLEVGDVQARQGRIVAAADTYDAVAGRARRAALPLIMGQAMFRKAVLYGAVASVQPTYRDAARTAVRQLRATTDPALQPFRDGVALLEARLAPDGGRGAAIDRVLAAYRAHPAARPVLVYSPPIDLHQAEQGSTLATRARGDTVAQWADISFWVGADGSVRDVAVLRESPNRDGVWLDAVTRSLAARRYAPMAIDPTGPGVPRVERYSLIFDRAFETGSRLVTRAPVGRITTTDLTDDAPAG